MTIDIETVEISAYGGPRMAVNEVINSEDEMIKFFSNPSQVQESQELPDVDYDNYTALAAALGPRSKGGYSIEITEVKETAEGLLAIVKSSSPGKAMTSYALTSPYHIIKIPKYDGNISFKNDEKTGNDPYANFVNRARNKGLR